MGDRAPAQNALRRHPRGSVPSTTHAPNNTSVIDQLSEGAKYMAAIPVQFGAADYRDGTLASFNRRRRPQA
jgi:hypothetical protein